MKKKKMRVLEMVGDDDRGRRDRIDQVEYEVHGPQSTDSQSGY